MSSMAQYRDFRLRHARAAGTRSTPAGAQPRIVRRVLEAIDRWYLHQTEREAGRFIAAHGGRLTDDIERQLTEHLGDRGLAPWSTSRKS
jgi:ribosomal protein S19E (S16A)